jgi:hypothetical protein
MRCARDELPQREVDPREHAKQVIARLIRRAGGEPGAIALPFVDRALHDYQQIPGRDAQFV